VALLIIYFKCESWFLCRNFRKIQSTHRAQSWDAFSNELCAARGFCIGVHRRWSVVSESHISLELRKHRHTRFYSFYVIKIYGLKFNDDYLW